MTDITAIGVAPAEPAPPIPPGPEAIAEVEAAPADAPAERILPEIGHAIGATRQKILDEFLDSDRAELSMSEIKAALPSILPGTIEACVRRELLAGRLDRVSPGIYRLAAATPPEAKPAPLPEPDKSEDEWYAAFDAWVNDPESWDRLVLGPRPNEPGRRIHADIVARGVDRSRKREQRRREAGAAAVRRTAADAELRTTLLTACNGNFTANLQVDDLAPIREVLKVLPLDRVVMIIWQKVDRRSYPANPPLSSWRDQSFLKALAEEFCRAFAIPGLMREWSAAGTRPTPTVQSSPAAVASVPAGDIDRAHHDAEHAPAGPHTVEAAPPEPAGASEAPAAV